MIVDYSGWEKSRGNFKDKYIVPNTGMIIVDGEKEYKQLSDFEYIEKDWNNDDDIYTLYVAKFESRHGYDYYTPENLVSLIVHEDMQVKGITKF